MKKHIIGYLAIVFLILAGCTVVRNVEDPPGSGQFKQVAETDPRVTTGIETVTGVNTVTSPINPWHGLITAIIAGVAGVAEWNKRRKQAQLDAVVAGVEAKGGDDVKKAIRNVAMAKGVEDSLNKTVKRVTGG